VLEQAKLREPFDHAADRGGGELEEPSDITRGRGTALGAKPVNGFEIVLDGPSKCISAGGCVHAKLRFRLG
jgi:hypothetical protein